MPPRCLSSTPTSRPARSPGAGIVAPGIGAVSLARQGRRSPTRRPTRTASCAPTRRAASSRSRRSRRRRPSTPARCSSAPACCCARRSTASVKMAFAKPDIRGKEIEIAAAFYIKRGQEARSRRAGDAGRPRQQRQGRHPGDRLCAGRARLCQGLALREPAARTTEPNSGRFIPPLAKGDHAWMSKPLPPSVFSQGRAEMPRHRASISRRAAKACGARPRSRRSCSTASATRPIRRRSAASSTRTTTGATAASSPSPATASRTASPAAPHYKMAEEIAHGGDRRQDLPSRRSAPRPITTPPMSARAGRAPCRR